MRPMLALFLVACGASVPPTQDPAALPHPSATASAEPAKKDPISLVQSTIPHLLDLLARGEDERFIDEAVVPEEMQKVLGDRTKAELVAHFKKDKHDGVVRMLEHVKTQEPSRVTQGPDERVLVTYESGSDREVTFIVEGQRVFIKN